MIVTVPAAFVLVRRAPVEPAKITEWGNGERGAGCAIEKKVVWCKWVHAEQSRAQRSTEHTRFKLVAYAKIVL